MPWWSTCSISPACGTRPGRSAPRIDAGFRSRTLRNHAVAESLTSLTMQVNEMAADRTRLRNDMLIASTLVVAGVAIAALSLHAINAAPPQEMAQATQPLQTTPSPDPQQTAPP